VSARATARRPTVRSAALRGDRRRTDGRDRRHDLAQLELVQDGRLTGCVEAHHQDAHLLLGEEPAAVGRGAGGSGVTVSSGAVARTRTPCRAGRGHVLCGHGRTRRAPTRAGRRPPPRAAEPAVWLREPRCAVSRVLRSRGSRGAPAPVRCYILGRVTAAAAPAAAGVQDQPRGQPLRCLPTSKALC
jgi:hypothetical protein